MLYEWVENIQAPLVAAALPQDFHASPRTQLEEDDARPVHDADPPFAIPLEPVVGGGESERITAHDSSSVPWRFRLTARQALTVCSGAE